MNTKKFYAIKDKEKQLFRVPHPFAGSLWEDQPSLNCLSADKLAEEIAVRRLQQNQPSLKDKVEVVELTLSWE